MWLINPYRFGDPDAAAYIAAVEAADGQVLEAAVASAITAFVVGCKTDGTWDALKASCIMAGARTLAGALVPLRGAAPTNFNFVAGDYNRKTGLKGDGSTKYLNANRNNNVDPQDNAHISAYSTEFPVSGSFPLYVGSSGGLGAKNIYKNQSNSNTESQLNGGLASVSLGNYVGFFGSTRSISTTQLFRANATTSSFSITSLAPSSLSNGVFAAPGGNLAITYSNARLSFYSIGEAIDLALLDARLTTLMNALAAAIP